MSTTKTKSLVTYSLNLGIRGTTIGFKFLFTLFLGKFYSEEMLGEYGLFATTILFSYFILSLSFESFALREIIQKPQEKQLSYIRNLFIFFACSLLIFIPVSAIVIGYGLLSNKLLLYFSIILILETFGQVFFALFTILQKSVAANLVLFFNQALWIILVFILWIINQDIFISLENFLILWIVGGVLAGGYGFFQIRNAYKTFPLEKIDWKWIKGGISVSLLFFLSALGYKVIEFTDRYFIEFQLGTSKLGIYVFYSQIANLMNTVINVTVILMLYPRLIENYVKGDIGAFLLIKKKMYQRVAIIAICLSVLAILFIRIILIFIGKESFHEEISVFYILLLANLAMNLSFIPHYCLYAMRKDSALLYTTLAGSATSVCLNLVLIKPFGIQGAALSTCAGFTLIWILKSLYINKKSLTPHGS
jgi:O-antigen/teichoic acid export membrane protein